MREKTYRNSPKGRSEIPEKAGLYMLLDSNGNDARNGVCGGWSRTDNLRRRIKEHHYDKSKRFSYIKIKKSGKVIKKNER